MKTALLFASLMTAASASPALTLKGASPLTEWNTSQAGQALLKQDQVSAQVDIALTGDLKLAYKGYTKIDVCDEIGEPLAGEPESAPCLKSHPAWYPKYALELPVALTTKVEDVAGKQDTVLSADLTSCIQNYDSLVQTRKPSAAPARAILKAKCGFYPVSSQIRTSGVSAKLANSVIEAITSVLLEGQIGSSRVIAIDEGKVSAEAAKEIAQAVKTLKSAGVANNVYVSAKVKSRAGKALDLFNYGLTIDLK